MNKRKRAKKSRVRKPCQERAVLTVHAIVSAAAQVLAERGYLRATTNHIAKRAGVSVASFYEYFADKDAAVRAVVERLADEAIALWISWGRLLLTHAPRDVLHQAVREAVALMTARGPLFRRLQEIPYVWTLPKTEGLVAQVAMVVRSFVAGQKLLPAEEVTEDRLYFAAALANSLIPHIAVMPAFETRRDALVEEFIFLLDCYYAGIMARATDRCRQRTLNAAGAEAGSW